MQEHQSVERDVVLRDDGTTPSVPRTPESPRLPCIGTPGSERDMEVMRDQQDGRAQNQSTNAQLNALTMAFEASAIGQSAAVPTQNPPEWRDMRPRRNRRMAWMDEVIEREAKGNVIPENADDEEIARASTFSNSIPSVPSRRYARKPLALLPSYSESATTGQGLTTPDGRKPLAPLPSYSDGAAKGRGLATPDGPKTLAPLPSSSDGAAAGRGLTTSDGRKTLAPLPSYSDSAATRRGLTTPDRRLPYPDRRLPYTPLEIFQSTTFSCHPRRHRGERPAREQPKDSISPSEKAKQAYGLCHL